MINITMFWDGWMDYKMHIDCCFLDTFFRFVFKTWFYICFSFLYEFGCLTKRMVELISFEILFFYLFVFAPFHLGWNNVLKKDFNKRYKHVLKFNVVDICQYIKVTIRNGITDHTLEYL